MNRDFFDKVFKFCQNFRISAFVMRNKDISWKGLSQGKLALLMNRFSSIQEPNIYQVKVLTSILSMNKDQVNRSKLLDLFIRDSQLLKEILNKDKLVVFDIVRLLKYTPKPAEKVESKGEETSDAADKIVKTEKEPSLFDVYRLVRRFNDLGHQNDVFDDLLRSYLRKGTYSSYIDLIVGSFLARNGHLPLDGGLAILEKFQQTQNLELIFPIACRILASNKASAEQKELATKIADKYVEKLDKESQEIESRNAIRLVSEYLQLPISYLQEKHDKKVFSLLKDNIEQTSIRTYLETLNTFPKRIAKTNFEFYFPFLKELASHYPNIGKSLRAFQLIEIMDFFSSSNLRSPALYNAILEDIFKVFNQLRTNDLVTLIESLGKLQFKQLDVLDRALAQIKDEGLQKLSRTELEILLKSFFRLGYDTQLVKESLGEILKLRQMTPNCKFLFT